MRHWCEALRRGPLLRAALCLPIILLLVPPAGCGAPGDRGTPGSERPGAGGHRPPPAVAGLTLSGPTVTREGGDDLYTAEGRVELTLDVTVSGARRVVVTAIDRAEPETPLFRGEARLDLKAERAVVAWSLPGHSFEATIRVRAENDAGSVVEDLATLVHRIPEGEYRPVHTFGHQAAPFGEWRELPDLPRYFRVHGWLDEGRIWGETGGNPVICEPATGNWRSLNVRTWGLWLEPGGRRFVYTDGEGLWTIPVAGGESRLLLPIRPFAAADDAPPGPLTDLPLYPERLSWSPDGSQLLLVTSSEGPDQTFLYDLEAASLAHLNLRGTPVAWIDGDRLLLEQRSHETGDGLRVPGVEHSARTDLAVATLSGAGEGRAVAGVETITSGEDGLYYDFLGWLDEAAGRFLFRRVERELRPGEGGTVLVGDAARTIIGARRPGGGPGEAWEIPPGVRVTGGLQGETVWLARPAGHLEAGAQINRLLDLGVIRDGGFRPLYRLEYLEEVWGPFFGPTGTGAITLWAGGPGERQPGYRTYLLPPPGPARGAASWCTSPRSGADLEFNQPTLEVVTGSQGPPPRVAVPDSL